MEESDQPHSPAHRHFSKFNMVVEIPQWTNVKMVIATEESLSKIQRMPGSSLTCGIMVSSLRPGKSPIEKIRAQTAVEIMGETDHKLIAINVNDPKASKFHDIDNVKKYESSYLEVMLNCFRYQVDSHFLFSGEFKSKAFALEIMKPTH
ncbi:LOW QUALITY PROTEIN: Inorganic pyrophosphatase 2, mitochondrial, partial [Galemys pyrenaicus]